MGNTERIIVIVFLLVMAALPAAGRFITNYKGDSEHQVGYTKKGLAWSFGFALMAIAILFRQNPLDWVEKLKGFIAGLAGA